jgi:hypothetical protein
MFIVDPDNNVDRRCDISGGGPGRHWIVMRAMTTRRVRLAYLVRHDETGEFRVAVGMPAEGLPQMCSLY